MALVALTSASLADVEPDVAGAASGLVNVSQQIGAAVGLAVLVTAFNAFLGHGQLAAVAAVDPSKVVHSFDLIFGAAAFFSLAALAMIVVGVRGAKAEDMVLDEVVGDAVWEDEDRVLAVCGRVGPRSRAWGMTKGRTMWCAPSFRSSPGRARDSRPWARYLNL